MQSKKRMDQKKACKIAALIILLLIVCFTLCDVDDWNSVGIYLGCDFSHRLIYPFFHANFLHAALNLWCFLSVIFLYDTSIWRLVLAYFIAGTIPSACLSCIPTVGLSGVVFALFGSISFEVQRKAYYQLCMLAYLVAGFLFPNTNALVHLYCYLAGGAVALLNKPVKIG